MSEFARRILDDEEIKIGTCADMYYLRYEDRFAVSQISGNVNPAQTGLRFRLPFPDEDEILPGNYVDYNRGVRLYRVDTDSYNYSVCVDYCDEALADTPGQIQLRHDSGLIFCIPCYHGVKLPEIPGIRFHWNGKTHAIELCQVKNTESGILPVIRCRHCREKWLGAWAEIWDYIPEGELKTRLAVHWFNQQVAAA